MMALWPMCSSERLLVVDADVDPALEDAAEAAVLEALVGVVLHRFVVEQAIDQSAVGARIELVQSALVNGAPFRIDDGEGGIDDEGGDDER